jgi:peptide/nickel transport system substrate-binding protein
VGWTGTLVRGGPFRPRQVGRRGVLIGALCAGALLSACGGASRSGQPAIDPTEAAATDSNAVSDDARAGGTLRLAALDWADHEQRLTSPNGRVRYALDPQAEFSPSAFELFRCCLLRTLMSFNGRPTAEGGADPQPDLAAGEPEVSPDGLTWTFRLEPGLRYAPPFDGTEIVVGDVVRAIERMLRPASTSWTDATGRPYIGAYSFYYDSVIEGARAFADGKADSISGLETPDEHTLVVHLLVPTGDLAVRFALPATAPIPPGADDGHDDGYGPYLVASGPYLVEGYDPGRSLTLTRNPSWERRTDGLREAYADRIELSFGGASPAAFDAVAQGTSDLVFDAPPPPAMLESYGADADLRSRLAIFPLDAVRYVMMNLAVPPFDELAVRQAANLVVDREALLASSGKYTVRGSIASHIAPDFLENNLLLGYDPYSAPSEERLARAREALARSSYDENGDGRCDASVCHGIRLLVRDEEPYPQVAKLVADELRKLGIDVSLAVRDPDSFFEELLDPTSHVPMAVGDGWAKDFPNGSSWFIPLFSSDNLGNPNTSLVGAAPDQLDEWGYDVTKVPSADRKIAECLALVGGSQFSCWAELDQLLMETVVPWIPFEFRNDARVFSSRVAEYSIDQAFVMPALDRIALDETGG